MIKYHLEMAKLTSNWNYPLSNFNIMKWNYAFRVIHSSLIQIRSFTQFTGHNQIIILKIFLLALTLLWFITSSVLNLLDFLIFLWSMHSSKLFFIFLIVFNQELFVLIVFLFFFTHHFPPKHCLPFVNFFWKYSV